MTLAGLPQSVKDLAEMSPAEDFVFALLRDKLAPIPVQSEIEVNQTFPLVLVRRGDSFGLWGGHPRFIDSVMLVVHTFCLDPDGDEDAALLAEAVRVILRDARINQDTVPGRGHISHLKMLNAPRRAPDWATAQGPVQYADLPTGVHRYETRFQIGVRVPNDLTL